MIRQIGNICASDSSVLLKMWETDVPCEKRVWQKHSHIQFEIGYVLSGEGTYSAGDNLYDIKSGDVFIFASNELHTITYIGEKGLHLLNLQFDPRYLWGNSTDSLSEESINLCFSHNQDFENRIPAEKAKKLSAYILEIRNEFENGEIEYKLNVKSLLNLILITLIRDFDYTKKSTPLSRDRLRSIRKVVAYIDQNLSEDLSLKVLSDIAGVTPNYFSALFHSVSGITLWEYINSKRIDKAIHLIAEKELSMLEIANECGFNNTANFNKIFKRHTGMTPREYRTCGETIVDK